MELKALTYYQRWVLFCINKMNRENNSPFYSYNTFRNYNNGVGGVIDPRPDKKFKK